jgi:glycosyltransferase involved in cell wall biosynthesis
MRIGILTKAFSAWAGGIDFIKDIALCTFETNAKHFYEIVLFIPRDDNIRLFKKYLNIFKYFLNTFFKLKIPINRTWEKFDQKYLENMLPNLSKNKIVLHSYWRSLDLAFAKNNNYDLIFPLISPPPINYPVAWIGYLYDFQHKYYPQFFKKKEIDQRNKDFYNLLNRADHLITQAKSVKADAEKFFKKFNAQIHVLPFAPFLKNEWLIDNRDLSSKYFINKPYFIICNQFWKHKNHKIAFEAFKQLLDLKGRNYELVCTGNKEDIRDPKYYIYLEKYLEQLNIKNDVKILGYIPKLDQISLIKKSISLIQPTLFEGNPGGGSGYDAISLGHPLIISNIPVNLEIENSEENIFFFEPNDSLDLLKKMLISINLNYKKPNYNILIKKSLDRKKECGEKIISIINLALAK